MTEEEKTAWQNNAQRREEISKYILALEGLTNGRVFLDWSNVGLGNDDKESFYYKQCEKALNGIHAAIETHSFNNKIGWRVASAFICFYMDVVDATGGRYWDIKIRDDAIRMLCYVKDGKADKEKINALVDKFGEEARADEVDFRSTEDEDYEELKIRFWWD